MSPPITTSVIPVTKASGGAGTASVDPTEEGEEEDDDDDYDEEEEDEEDVMEESEFDDVDFTKRFKVCDPSFITGETLVQHTLCAAVPVFG